MCYVGNAVPSVTTGGFLVGIFYLRNSRGTCSLQRREMAKSKEIRRFRQLYSQWLIYIYLKRLPATAGEYMEKGTQDLGGCCILNALILCYICSTPAKQYMEVLGGGTEGGICGREFSGKGGF